jgi:hypothetical protein
MWRRRRRRRRRRALKKKRGGNRGGNEANTKAENLILENFIRTPCFVLAVILSSAN